LANTLFARPLVCVCVCVGVSLFFVVG